MIERQFSPLRQAPTSKSQLLSVLGRLRNFIPDSNPIVEEEENSLRYARGYGRQNEESSETNVRQTEKALGWADSISRLYGLNGTKRRMNKKRHDLRNLATKGLEKSPVTTPIGVAMRIDVFKQDQEVARLLDNVRDADNDLRFMCVLAESIQRNLSHGFIDPEPVPEPNPFFNRRSQIEISVRDAFKLIQEFKRLRNNFESNINILGRTEHTQAWQERERKKERKKKELIGPVKKTLDPEGISHKIIITMKKMGVDDGFVDKALNSMGLARSHSGKTFTCSENTLAESFLLMDDFHKKLLSRVKKGIGYIQEYPELADIVLETAMNFLVVDSLRRIIASQMRTEVGTTVMQRKNENTVKKTDWFIEREVEAKEKELKRVEDDQYFYSKGAKRELNGLIERIPVTEPILKSTARKLRHLIHVGLLSNTFPSYNPTFSEQVARVIGTPDRLRIQWTKERLAKKKRILRKEQEELRRQMKERALRKKKLEAITEDTEQQALNNLLKKTRKENIFRQ